MLQATFTKNHYVCQEFVSTTLKAHASVVRKFEPIVNDNYRITFVYDPRLKNSFAYAYMGMPLLFIYYF